MCVAVYYFVVVLDARSLVDYDEHRSITSNIMDMVWKIDLPISLVMQTISLAISASHLWIISACLNVERQTSVTASMLLLWLLAP